MKISSLLLMCTPGAHALFVKVGTITGFKLVSAPNGTVISDLSDGKAIYLNNTTPGMTVVATSSGRIRSVNMGFNAVANYRTEKTAPYTLGGGFSYAACKDLVPGKHTVTATPRRGKAVKVSFELVAGFAPGAPTAPVKTPAVPTVPTVPTIPTVPTVPTVPTAPMAPMAPMAPTAPMVPTVPTVPSVPISPTLPTVPTVPTVPTALMAPTAPMAPKAPKAPTAPTVLTLPTVPRAAPVVPPVKAPSAPAAAPVMAPALNPANKLVKAPSTPIAAAPVTAPKASTKAPVDAPTKAPATPTKLPIKAPTTKVPTKGPTKAPTKTTTKAPTKTPTKAPVVTPGTFPININCGGAAYSRQSGEWMGDTFYTRGSGTFGVTNAIDGTDDDVLFQSQRISNTGGTVQYNIPVLSGTNSYNVLLNFAELVENVGNARVFDVSLEGSRVYPNLDVFSLNGKFWKTRLSFNVVVSKGFLTIDLTPIKGSAFINTIEVYLL